MNIPTDPFILLSFINTKLRDEYPDLDTFCRKTDQDKEILLNKLLSIEYIYHQVQNQFVSKDY